MISAIQHRANVLSSSNPYNNRGKEVNPDKGFFKLKLRVYRQFKARYTRHYLFNAFTKEELIGMKRTRIPCLFDKYKIDELVLNKKSHLNALFKEGTLLTLPYMSLIKMYKTMEQLCVLRNLMLLPNEFPPNLFPSGKKILSIIANRQTLLLHNANRRFEEFKRYHRKSQVTFHQETSPNVNAYQEEEFKLADISLSLVEHKDDFFHFYFKKGIYSTEHNYLSKKQKKPKTIKEIEYLISEIAKSEENIEKQKSDTRKRYSKIVSIKTIRSNRRRESINKYPNEKVMLTTVTDPKADQYMVTTPSSTYNPRNITIERHSRKFKTVDQFFSISHSIQKKKQQKSSLMNELVDKFNKLKRENSNKKRRYNVGVIPHFNTISVSPKETDLHFKTMKVFKTIEAFNLTQRDSIIKGYNFDKSKKFPMIYSKNIIQSRRNQMKRFYLDKGIEKK